MFKLLIACDQTYENSFLGLFPRRGEEFSTWFSWTTQFLRGKTKKCQSERLPNSWRPYKARNGFMVQ